MRYTEKYSGKEFPISILEHLNDEQKEVVTHFEGPLLVLAGAGSGKTRTITYRIAHLVNFFGVEPSQIVALTFTNKAAREMHRRLLHFPNGTALRDVTATTFHSFGLMLLKEHAAGLGLQPGFQVIDDDDQIRLLKEVTSLLNISSEDFPPKKVRGVIDAWKNQGTDLPVFLRESFYADFMKEVYGKIINAYERLKNERGLFDFGDLLFRLLAALNENSAFRDSCQTRYRFILVDEYQDTNAIQYRIIRKFAEPHGNLAVVGDDDQSIYSFRGAEIRNILDFQRDFPAAKVVRLTKNYRSSRTIIEAANAVISLNRQRMAKALDPTREEGDPITLFSAFDEKEESAWVLRQIMRRLEEGYGHRDIAVFYRTNVLSRRFEDALRRDRIPYRIFGSIRFYNRREVKDIIACIRFLLNKKDILSFGRVAQFAIPGVGKTTVDKLIASVRSRDILDSIRRFIDEEKPAPRITLALKAFLALAAKLDAELAASDPATFVDLFLDLTSYRDHLRKDVKDDRELDERMKNVDELKVALAENRKEGKSYADFINEIVLEDIHADDASDFVTLMTVHSAKGLEFPVVFITGLEDDIFPHAFSKLENNVEEERRLFYVAITRARELLYMSHARSRNNKPQRISPFVGSIPEHLIREVSIRQQQRPVTALPERSPFDDERPPAMPKHVYHDHFGRGEIIATVNEGDNPVFLVRFQQAGVKKILGSFLRTA